MAAKKKAKKVGRKAKATSTAKARKCALEEEKNSVWVNWEYTHGSGGEIREGQEEDEWPSRETEYHDHAVHGAFTTDKDDRGWSRYNERMAVDFEPVSGEQVFVVVVTYGSGGTFGSSSGNVCIVAVFSNEAHANSIAQDIRADDDLTDRYGEPKKGKKERFTGYKPWKGYFESLEGVEVHRLLLDEQAGVKRF
jgi:hypothetical protein